MDGGVILEGAGHCQLMSKEHRCLSNMSPCFRQFLHHGFRWCVFGQRDYIFCELWSTTHPPPRCPSMTTVLLECRSDSGGDNHCHSMAKHNHRGTGVFWCLRNGGGGVLERGQHLCQEWRFGHDGLHFRTVHDVMGQRWMLSVMFALYFCATAVAHRQPPRRCSCVHFLGSGCCFEKGGDTSVGGVQKCPSVSQLSLPNYDLLVIVLPQATNPSPFVMERYLWSLIGH